MAVGLVGVAGVAAVAVGDTRGFRRAAQMRHRLGHNRDIAYPAVAPRKPQTGHGVGGVRRPFPSALLMDVDARHLSAFLAVVEHETVISIVHLEECRAG